MRVNPAFSTILCTSREIAGLRPQPAIWVEQHNKFWTLGWMQEDDVNCQGDEFPPAVVWQGRAGPGQAWIRQLPGDQNGPAGSLFRGICPLVAPASKESPPQQIGGPQVVGCRTTTHVRVTETITWPALVLNFIGIPPFPANDPDGLIANPCWPNQLVNDPGFALLLTDPYYKANPVAQAFGLASYNQPPSAAITNGHINRPHWVSNLNEEQSLLAVNYSDNQAFEPSQNAPK